MNNIYDDDYQLMREDSKSLLVITTSGQLIRLNCPFPVLCRREHENIKVGETAIVDAVLMEPFEANDLIFEIIIFIINHNKIYYWYFKIL